MYNRFFAAVFERADGNVCAAATPNPMLDMRFEEIRNGGVGFGRGHIISPPIPLHLADEIVRRLNEHREVRRYRRYLKRGVREARFVLRWTPWRRFAARDVCVDRTEQGLFWPRGVSGTVEPSEGIIQTTRAMLGGKVELLSQCERYLFRSGGTSGYRAVDLLYWLNLLGDIQLLPAIIFDRWGRGRCVRCGSDRILAAACPICGRTACGQCTECESLGIVRACDAVVKCPGVKRVSPAPLGESHGRLYQLDFTLTPAQRDASLQLKEFVSKQLSSHGPSRKHLLWAVCGAGKTEVVFDAVDTSLKKGYAVLYAAPRRDVVIEIRERLEQAFPSLEITALYGGSGKKETGDITLATTHQVMRFSQAFRLVILDEVDAFPYKGSRMLRDAVERAAAPSAAIILLTATPDDELWDDVLEGRIGLTCIPVRHHGKPLPVPEVEVVPAAKRWRWVADRLQGDLAGHRTFIFVSTIAKGRELYESLLGAGLSLEFTSAKDPKRDSKVAAFRAGRLTALVTTTILERGITVPNSSVIVFDADNLFTTSSLVQMAGRVGRTGDEPIGRCFFLCVKKSPSLRRAVDMVSELNRRAAEGGYLK